MSFFFPSFHWTRKRLQETEEKKMVARRRFTPRERSKVAFEQSYQCSACKVMLNPDWHLDHVIPLADGGTNERDNVQALCIACHTDKSAAATRATRPRRKKRTMITRLIRFVQEMLAYPEVRILVDRRDARAMPLPRPIA